MLNLLETVPLEDYVCQRVIHAYCASFGQIYALGDALGAICAWGHALTFNRVIQKHTPIFHKRVPLEDYVCRRVIQAYCASFCQIHALGGGLGAFCIWVPRPNP